MNPRENSTHIEVVEEALVHFLRSARESAQYGYKATSPKNIRKNLRLLDASILSSP
jgi:hypothetical protein